MAQVPNFATKDEETAYWKEKATEWEQKARALEDRVADIEAEFEDFREISSTLEKELEKALEQSDQSFRDMRTKCNRLTFDLDAVKEKLTEVTKENNGMHKELEKYRESEEKLLSYVRELEQKNDDVERCHRAMMETVDDIQVQLNSQIEKNALLETELDEKDALQTMVQRLKDEQRDLQQELQRQLRQRFPDNDRSVRSPIVVVDSNKICEPVGSTTNATATPVKMSASMGQLSPPASRVTALNLVGDLLRKVGSLESKLAASRIVKENADSSNRESYRSRNQRLNHRTTASPTINGSVKL